MKSYIIRITQGKYPYAFYHMDCYRGETLEDCLLEAYARAGISAENAYDFEINACGHGRALCREAGQKAFYKKM